MLGHHAVGCGLLLLQQRELVGRHEHPGVGEQTDVARMVLVQVGEDDRVDVADRPTDPAQPCRQVVCCVDVEVCLAAVRPSEHAARVVARLQ